ncbi:EmrB/QacA subfamily drug resistance transporter [Kribbella aluminosa]|uniref:EmrB/QacA subfamily drug resistance transporter n=1 Tax=Kribbella aluminosa TaxID=416017 RepID=A0ABS4UTE8_9ACTN|nr:MFS transporter [Kribbella aluminosa]MBP2354907.1 EmrB/QacA subfamily drug resistance transporter [Kribbella aluminosa]
MSQPDPRRWRLLGLLAVAQFMLILDVTVVAIALPNIETDLHLQRETLTWVVSAYTLMFGGLMLLGGRAADLFGARRVVLTGLAVFTLASLVTGLANGPEVLLGGRVAQGIGAAMLSPAALSVVTKTFSGTERNKALGIWSAMGGGGSAIGVLLGGLLTAGPGWQWVFYINLPIGLVVFTLLLRMLPAGKPGKPGEQQGRLDVPGALLVTAGTGTAIYALINAGDRGWLSVATLGTLAGALVLYGVFGWVQRSVRSPLMDVRILARRSVAAGTLMILVATALMISMFFLGSFYLQHFKQYGALRTGLLFLPVAVAAIVGAHLAGQLVGKVGARPIAIAGFLLTAIGVAAPALWEGAAVVVSGMAVGTIGLGASFVASSTTTFAQVDHHEAGLASGILSTFHEFGASLGVAVVSSVAAASLAGTVTTGFTRGFTFAAVTAAVAAALTLIVVPSFKPSGEPVHVH